MISLTPRQAAAAWRVLAVGVVCGLLAGCGSGSRYSGKVTFAGKPVPTGKIYFTPDGSKGNKGQAGWADIKDGHYDTSVRGSQSPAGGAMTVRIEGQEGGKPLFGDYELKEELPKGGGSKDFDVPAAQGAKAPKVVGPPP